MKYICEVCKKQYDTVTEAEKCELAHKKAEADKSAKVTAETTINDAVNAYIAKYREIPNINISSENRKVLLSDMPKRLEQAFDELIDAFFNAE